MKLLLTYFTVSVALADQIPYSQATTSITLREGHYTEHRRQTHKPEIICFGKSGLSSCPTRIHCFRPSHEPLHKETEWSCDLKGSYTELWKINKIKWEDAPELSQDQGSFPNSNTFYAELHPVPPPSFLGCITCLLLIAIPLYLLSQITKGLNMDFGDFGLGVGFFMILNDLFSDDSMRRMAAGRHRAGG
jgi:hypothetical protein